MSYTSSMDDLFNTWENNIPKPGSMDDKQSFPYTKKMNNIQLEQLKGAVSRRFLWFLLKIHWILASNTLLVLKLFLHR